MGLTYLTEPILPYPPPLSTSFRMHHPLHPSPAPPLLCSTDPTHPTGEHADEKPVHCMSSPQARAWR